MCFHNSLLSFVCQLYFSFYSIFLSFKILIFHFPINIRNLSFVLSVFFLYSLDFFLIYAIVYLRTDGFTIFIQKELFILQTTSNKERNFYARKEYIMNCLDQAEHIKVNEISAALNISPVTIRKDLERLEAEGLLRRTHGGAQRIASLPQSVPDPAPQMISSGIPEEEHYLEKQAIAAAAANLVSDGDYVFISSGTTCLHVCEALKTKKNLTVVTNSLEILNSLMQTPSVTTFFLGGKVHTEMQITVGEDVIEQMNKYTADKLFLGMDGVDVAAGATTCNHVEESIMRQMLQQSKQKILVADHSKIGKVAFARIAPLTAFDTIVTNQTPDNGSALEGMRALGVQVICA